MNRQRKHHHGAGAPQARYPASGPATDQDHRSGRRDEGNQYRQWSDEADVDGNDGQHGDHHVEVVGGEPGVPVGGPAAEPEPGQQLVAEEGRPPHVGTQIAAGRGGLGEQDSVGVDHPEDEQGRKAHRGTGQPRAGRYGGQSADHGRSPDRRSGGRQGFGGVHRWPLRLSGWGEGG